MSENKTTVTLVRFVKGEVSSDLRRETVYADYVAENGVTLETVNEHAATLMGIAYPGVKPSSRAEAKSQAGRANNFRNKVRNGLNRALAVEDETPKPSILRVSLSGEGGGSSVVEMDTDLGRAILAFLAGEAADKAA